MASVSLRLAGFVDLRLQVLVLKDSRELPGLCMRSYCYLHGQGASFCKGPPFWKRPSKGLCLKAHGL